MAIKSINVKFPLVKGSAGAFETNKTTIDAVKDNLKILILSNYGERCIHFDFGANLRELLFEQGADLEQKIRDRIAAAILKWMPFVTITKFSAQPINDNHEIKISMEFAVGQLTGKLDLPIRA